MSAAKTEILRRIREAQQATRGEDWAQTILDGAAIEPGQSYHVTREYETGRQTDRETLIKLLDDRLEDYGAAIIHCDADDAAIAAAVAEQTASLSHVAVPEGLKKTWLNDVSSHITTDSPNTDPRTLNEVDGIVTSSAVSSAETGTIFLDGSADNGRRALSLVPDVHICVVPINTVVHGIPEAIARLTPTNPITMISGPSATSDIELNRVEGVHGPRTLIVIIAG